jgi:hypothetical protein
LKFRVLEIRREAWDTQCMADRPRDPNQLAKMIVDIATGEVPDTVSDSKRHPETLRGRAGGIVGGMARARALSPKKRAAIARKAATSRWKKR